jgi:hypothetical protein
MLIEAAINKKISPFANLLFLPKLEETRKQFQLYGTDKEINILEDFKTKKADLLLLASLCQWQVILTPVM